MVFQLSICRFPGYLKLCRVHIKLCDNISNASLYFLGKLVENSDEFRDQFVFLALQRMMNVDQYRGLPPELRRWRAEEVVNTFGGEGQSALEPLMALPERDSGGSKEKSPEEEFGFSVHRRYADRPDKTQDALSFFLEEWGEELAEGRLYQFQLDKIDHKLLKAVKNYCGLRQIKVSDIIPTKSDSLSVEEVSDEELRQATKLARTLECRVREIALSGIQVPATLRAELREAHRRRSALARRRQNRHSVKKS